MAHQSKIARLKGTFKLMKYGNRITSIWKIPFQASQRGRLIPLGKHSLSLWKAVPQEGQRALVHYGHSINIKHQPMAHSQLGIKIGIC